MQQPSSINLLSFTKYKIKITNHWNQMYDMNETDGFF